MNQNNKNQYFNEEMLHILKQQVNKLKLMNNELELKDHQIILLKDTIKSMQAEKDIQTQQNLNLKNSMKQLIDQVNLRNKKYEQIMAKIQQDKNRFEQQNLRLKKNISDNNNTIKKLNQQLLQSQKKNQNVLKEIKQFKQKIKHYTNNHKDTKIQIQNQKKQIKQLKENHKKMQQENQLLKSELSFSKQQINLMKNKYQQALQTAENRLRQTVTEKTKLKMYQTTQKNLQNLTQKYNEKKMEVDKLMQMMQIKQREILILKQARVTLQQQKVIYIQNIKMDVKNLMQIRNFGHKITQYVSIYKSNFEQIQKYVMSIIQRRQSMQKQRIVLQQQNEKLRKGLNKGEGQLQTLHKQLELIRIECTNELKKSQNNYQSKLITLQLQLKKQQKQLQKLQNKHKQLSSIQIQLEKIKKQTYQQKINHQKYTQSLQQQNQMLHQQINSIYTLCQQSILIKNKNNILKTVIAYILKYLFFSIQKNRTQMTLSSFFKSFIKFQPKNKPNISKFKKCALAIIIAIRLKNLTKKYKAIIKQPCQIKDGFIKRLVRQQSASETNQITSQYLDYMNNIILRHTKNEDEKLLSEQIVNSFQEYYLIGRNKLFDFRNQKLYQYNNRYESKRLNK